MCCRQAKGPAQQHGVALVVALLVFAVSAAIMVSMQREFNLFYRQVGNQIISDQAQSYLRGAEALASLALKTDYEQDQRRGGDPRDDLTELWAQEATPYALDEGGWLLGQLEDLQGRFNINTLEPGAPKDDGTEPGLTAAQEQFIRLLLSFENLELSEYDARSVTLAIGDWLDANDIASAAGAEDSDYMQRTPAYRAANRHITSVSELYAIDHVTPELMNVLEPLITVWPLSGGEINIHTAKPQVLRSFNGDGDLTPLTEEQVQQLVQTRQETGFAEDQEFLNHPVFAGKTTTNMATRIGKASRFFLLDATVDIADRKTHLYSVLKRDNGQINVVVRAAHSL